MVLPPIWQVRLGTSVKYLCLDFPICTKMCTCPILSLNQAVTDLLKITKYSESQTNKHILHPKIYGLALYWGTQVLHYKGKLGK